MSSKRDAPEAEDTATTSKKFRSAIDESLDEFLCPITQELPLEPVMAEDGQVYERSAVEDWLKRADPPRSPVTNLRMGPKLVAATQIKNMIERMVQSNAVPEEKAGAWRKRIKEQEKVHELRRKAEGGDAHAAFILGEAYYSGLYGLTQDLAKATTLHTQAAETGDAGAMGRLGRSYLCGVGVLKSEAFALRWASAAAALGDGRGTYVLGHIFFNGMAGLLVDKKQGFNLMLKGGESGESLNSFGMVLIARLYAEGEGTAVDMEAAAKWMRKAVLHASSSSGVQQARDWLAARGLEP